MDSLCCLDSCGFGQWVTSRRRGSSGHLLCGPQRQLSIAHPPYLAHPFLLKGVMAPPAAPPGSALSVFHKLLTSLSIVALFTHFELPSLSWHDLEHTHTHTHTHTFIYIHMHIYIQKTVEGILPVQVAKRHLLNCDLILWFHMFRE